MSAFMTDPSITLRGLQQPETPGEIMTRFAQLRQMSDERQVNALRMKEGNLRLTELQRTARGQDTLEKAIAAAGGDIRKAMPEIMKVAPQKGMEIQKQLDEWDQADNQKKISILDLHGKRMEAMGQLAGGVKDQASYEQAIQSGAQMQVLDPQTAQNLLARPYDPATVEQFKTQALTTQQQLAAQRQKLVDEETARHNREMEKSKPSAELADFKDFYNTYRQAKNLPLNAVSELQARQAFAELKRAPREPRSGTQRNTVERWKQTQLKALRDEATRRLRPDSMTGEATDAMGAEDFRNRWQEIQDSYEGQLNSDRHVEIPLSAAQENLRGGGGTGPQLGGANAGGNAGDAGPREGEVEVISPDGQRGYIPRANLPKALKRGYKQAAAQ